MKASKKLIGASVALVAALAVSVGSTYAWFTTNKYVTVEGIQANVTTGDATLEVAFVWEEATIGSNTNRKPGEIGQFGYNINLSDELYLKDILANTEFDALTDKGAAPFSYDPYSYEDETLDGYKLTDKTGTAATYAKYTAAQNEQQQASWATGNYLTFTLRFRTTSTNTDYQESGIKLLLSNTKSSVTSTKTQNETTGENNYPDIWVWDWIDEDTSADNWNTYFSGANIATGGKLEANAQDAVRVAFHEATVQVPVTNQGGTTDPGSVTVDGEHGKVWDPHAEEAWSAYTTKNMAQVIEEHLTGAEDLSDLYEDPGYTDVKTGEEVITMEYDTVSGYYYADIKFYIWIEGTDADCFNNIFADLINIQLGFELETLTD